MTARTYAPATTRPWRRYDSPVTNAPSPLQTTLGLGFGRLVASEKELPIILASESGYTEDEPQFKATTRPRPAIAARPARTSRGVRGRRARIAGTAGMCTNVAKKFHAAEGRNHLHTTSESKVVVHPGSVRAHPLAVTRP
jgi:hypothetical protein